MAYSTGVANTANELIDAIQTFAVAQGWTLDYAGADGSGKRLHIHNGSIYANMSSNYSPSTYLMAANMSSGFAGSGSAWNAQTAPRSSDKTVTSFSGALPLTYHLFAQASPVMLACVIKKSNGYSHYLVFGAVDKIGTYTGGEFIGADQPFYGECLNYYPQTPTYGFEFFNGTAFVANVAYTMTYQNYIATDPRNGVAPLFPVYIKSMPVANQLKLWGTMPWARILSKNYADGEEIVYGSDTWKVFYQDYPSGAFMVAFKK